MSTDPGDRFTALFGIGFGLLVWFKAGATATHVLVPVGNALVAGMVLAWLPRLRNQARAWPSYLGVALPLVVFYVYYLEAGIALASTRTQWHDAQVIAFEGGASAAIPTLAVPFLGPLLALAYVGYIPLLAIASFALYHASPPSPASPAPRTIRAITVAWAVCFVSYLLFPVLGPRLVDPGLQTARLGNGLIAQLAILHESRTMLHGAAFPSAHLAATTIVMLALWRWHRRLFWPLAPVAIGIGLGSVYLGYHYIADVIVGTVLGAIVFHSDRTVRGDAGLIARSVRSRRAKPWLAAMGVAVSTVLVLILAGAFHAVRGSMRSYAGQDNIDLWVAPPGADNLIRGSFSSLLPPAYIDSLQAMPGVRSAQPILKAFLPVEPLGEGHRAKQLTLLAIGYQVPDGLGGPPSYADGRPPRGRHEVALDRAAAFRLRVGAGDTIALAGRKVLVSGLTRGTNIIATQFLFADFSAASRSTGSDGNASFILVRLAPGVSPDRVASAIMERFPDLSAYPRDAFVAANQREVSAGILPLLGLLGAFGVAACAVLVGLLVHSVVEERRGDLAVLLALGADTRTLGAGVMRHALVLALVGVGAGSGLAWTLAALLDWKLPLIPLAIAATDAILVALVFLAASLIAALVPVLQLGRIDPLEAFRP
jgi:ABC-type antimicrobial peptide transport system permease subunit/membrane-associated phospholipid phosphatase